MIIVGKSIRDSRVLGYILVRLRVRGWFSEFSACGGAWRWCELIILFFILVAAKVIHRLIDH